VPSGPLPSGAEPALSLDGRVIVLAVSNDAGVGAQLTLVDTRSGRRNRIGSTSCPSGYDVYTFNTAGTRVAAATQCGEVAAYDVTTGHSLGRLDVGGSVADVAISPSGRQLAAASYDGTVTVADTDTGKVVARLTENTAAAVAVVFSPDGRYLATGGSDRTVRVFSASSYAELRVIKQPAQAGTVTFMPDSKQILTLDSDHVVRRWDACTDCQDKSALLALASTRVTRDLTPAERREFGVD
jgi:WD40 repeat protein